MTARQIAAILGFLGVALGAFGAHGLKDAIAHVPSGPEWWQKATMYHLVHAVAMLGTAREDGRASASTWCFVTGVALFSGSLYTMALTDLRWLGAVTPVGGVAFLAGWLLLLRSSKAS
jgi:uncharacterized membrane protein YgdD (TMEM256/DUF423 family)